MDKGGAEPATSCLLILCKRLPLLQVAQGARDGIGNNRFDKSCRHLQALRLLNPRGEYSGPGPGTDFERMELRFLAGGWEVCGRVTRCRWARSSPAAAS